MGRTRQPVPRQRVERGKPVGAESFRTMRRSVALPLACCLLLAACQSAPPPKPAAPDARAEQRAALDALGFSASDDGWLLNLPEPISFELEHDTLKPNMRDSIANTASGLLKANVSRLRIEGHTDNSGPRQHNLDLSRRRAHAVAVEFERHGFAESHVDEIGLGPDRPLQANDTRNGRAANRCVVIIVPADALVR